MKFTDISISRGASLLGLCLTLVVSSATAQEQETAPLGETSAREAMIVDAPTGAVLFEKNADTPFPPASLAKLMTMEIVFQALKAGEIEPGTEFRVSENAWRTGGAPSGTSTMFAEVRSSVPVSALIQGVIVQAANDAAIIIAEGMEGSEGAFADRMNRRAAELGLTNSRFVNATGLPAEDHYVTARDLTRLARHIETTYPELYRTYAQPEFEWNGILQRNRNPLLRRDVGASGMATGYTEAAGYSLVGLAEREDRKTVLALGGLESDVERAQEAERLLQWARESFERNRLFEQGQPVAGAEVFGGTAGSVPLVLSEDLVALVPKERPELVRARIVYEGPVQAPVAKGDEIGRIEITIDDRLSVSSPLVAGADVGAGTFAERAIGAAQELAFGWVRAL